RVECPLCPRKRIPVPLQKLRLLLEPGRVGPGSPKSRFSQQCRAFEKFAGHVLARGNFLGKPLSPGSKVIDPCLQRVLPAPQSSDRKTSEPAIVPHFRQGHFLPVGGSSWSVTENRGQGVVPIGVDVCRDDHLFAHGSLDGETPSVDLGVNPFDNHAGGNLCRQWYQVGSLVNPGPLVFPHDGTSPSCSPGCRRRCRPFVKICRYSRKREQNAHH